MTREGLPVGYDVFEGNRHDSKTLQEIVEAMEKRHGRANRIWVLDRGMVSDDNLEFLHEKGGQYIVGTPKSMLREFEKELLRKGVDGSRAGRRGTAMPRSARTGDFHCLP